MPGEQIEGWITAHEHAVNAQVIAGCVERIPSGTAPSSSGLNMVAGDSGVEGVGETVKCRRAITGEGWAVHERKGGYIEGRPLTNDVAAVGSNDHEPKSA